MEGYIREDSYLEYESDVYKVVYKGLGTSPDFELKSTRWGYKLEKIAYIPAERNIISVLPQWSTIKMSDTSTANFMEDWGNMRELFTADRPLNILSLGLNTIMINQVIKIISVWIMERRFNCFPLQVGCNR